jgi:hypothetical protein
MLAHRKHIPAPECAGIANVDLRVREAYAKRPLRGGYVQVPSYETSPIVPFLKSRFNQRAFKKRVITEKRK